MHKFDRPLAGQAVEEVLDRAQGLPAHGVPKAGARRDATRPLDVLLEGFQELRFAAGQVRLRARIGRLLRCSYHTGKRTGGAKTLI